MFKAICVPEICIPWELPRDGYLYGKPFCEMEEMFNRFPFSILTFQFSGPCIYGCGDYFYHNSFESEPEKVDAIEWFPEDFQIKFKKDWKLWEQSSRSCLTPVIQKLSIPHARVTHSLH